MQRRYCWHLKGSLLLSSPSALSARLPCQSYCFVLCSLLALLLLKMIFFLHALSNLLHLYIYVFPDLNIKDICFLCIVVKQSSYKRVNKLGRLKVQLFPDSTSFVSPRRVDSASESVARRRRSFSQVSTL